MIIVMIKMMLKYVWLQARFLEENVELILN